MSEDECLKLDERLRVVPKTNSRKALEVFALMIVALAMVVVGVIGVRLYESATRWDPLGDYPVQVAYSKVGDVRQQPQRSPLDNNSTTSPSVLLPTIYLGEEIHTTGIKCTATAEEVTVTGVLSWVSDLPPGRIIEVSRGGGPRGPGCITYEYANPIPPEVLEAIDELLEDGIVESEWHLTGTEIPVREDGTEGEPRTWTSTVFRVIHMERRK